MMNMVSKQEAQLKIKVDHQHAVSIKILSTASQLNKKSHWQRLATGK